MTTSNALPDGVTADDAVNRFLPEGPIEAEKTSTKTTTDAGMYGTDVMDAARDVMDAVRDVIPVACEALAPKQRFYRRESQSMKSVFDSFEDEDNSRIDEENALWIKSGRKFKNRMDNIISQYEEIARSDNLLEVDLDNGLVYDQFGKIVDGIGIPVFGKAANDRFSEEDTREVIKLQEDLDNEESDSDDCSGIISLGSEDLKDIDNQSHLSEGFDSDILPEDISPENPAKRFKKISDEFQRDYSKTIRVESSPPPSLRYSERQKKTVYPKDTEISQKDVANDNPTLHLNKKMSPDSDIDEHFVNIFNDPSEETAFVPNKLINASLENTTSSSVVTPSSHTKLKVEISSVRRSARKCKDVSYVKFYKNFPRKSPEDTTAVKSSSKSQSDSLSRQINDKSSTLKTNNAEKKKASSKKRFKKSVPISVCSNIEFSDEENQLQPLQLNFSPLSTSQPTSIIRGHTFKKTVVPILNDKHLLNSPSVKNTANSENFNNTSNDNNVLSADNSILPVRENNVSGGTFSVHNSNRSNSKSTPSSSKTKNKHSVLGRDKDKQTKSTKKNACLENNPHNMSHSVSGDAMFTDNTQNNTRKSNSRVLDSDDDYSSEEYAPLFSKTPVERNHMSTNYSLSSSDENIFKEISTGSRSKKYGKKRKMNSTSISTCHVPSKCQRLEKIIKKTGNRSSRCKKSNPDINCNYLPRKSQILTNDHRNLSNEEQHSLMVEPQEDMSCLDLSLCPLIPEQCKSRNKLQSLKELSSSSQDSSLKQASTISQQNFFQNVSYPRQCLTLYEEKRQLMVNNCSLWFPNPGPNPPENQSKSLSEIPVNSSKHSSQLILQQGNVSMEQNVTEAHYKFLKYSEYLSDMHGHSSRQLK
ncbi:hypothetical protein GQR58_000761 [Nymphon striatum]|nr:hypothetical protein GQR58_000761 [Nymphon striatum]